MSTVHAAPRGDDQFTRCCLHRPAELPGDEMTTYPALVTCGRGPDVCRSCGHPKHQHDPAADDWESTGACWDYLRPLDTEEIGKRWAGISPGPWRVERDSCGCEGGCGHGSYPYALHGPQPAAGPVAGLTGGVTEIMDLTDEDAEFIAQAPEDVAWLLAEVRRLHAALQAVTDLADPTTAGPLVPAAEIRRAVAR